MSYPISKIPWITKKIWLVASTLTLGLLIPSTFANVNALEVAVQKKAIFEASPRLIRTAATNRSTNGPSTYHFTIQVPENAGRALKAVTISQKDNPHHISLAVDRSNAFVGDSFAGGPDLQLADIGGDRSTNPNDVTFVFDEPVQPGETVTVRLKAKRNPRRNGIYLFGVTAFPEGGEDSSGLYLGSGRLHLYK